MYYIQDMLQVSVLLRITLIQIHGKKNPKNQIKTTYKSSCNFANAQKIQNYCHLCIPNLIQQIKQPWSFLYSNFRRMEYEKI